MKLPFITIIAALFCGFCKRLISILHAQLNTEQQYPNWVSWMLVKRLVKDEKGKILWNVLEDQVPWKLLKIQPGLVHSNQGCCLSELQCSCRCLKPQAPSHEFSLASSHSIYRAFCFCKDEQGMILEHSNIDASNFWVDKICPTVFCCYKWDTNHVSSFVERHKIVISYREYDGWLYRMCVQINKDHIHHIPVSNPLYQSITFLSRNSTVEWSSIIQDWSELM